MERPRDARFELRRLRGALRRRAPPPFSRKPSIGSHKTRSERGRSSYRQGAGAAHGLPRQGIQTMQHRRLTTLLSVTCLSLGYIACSSDDSDSSATGGAPSTGGAESASGGRSSSVGGEIVIPIGSGGKTTEGPGSGGAGGDIDGSLASVTSTMDRAWAIRRNRS
jgi:hypothetical protein